eukprot:7382470-Prymnesium_polylepis.2
MLYEPFTPEPRPRPSPSRTASSHLHPPPLPLPLPQATRRAPSWPSLAIAAPARGVFGSRGRWARPHRRWRRASTARSTPGAARRKDWAPSSARAATRKQRRPQRVLLRRPRACDLANRASRARRRQRAGATGPTAAVARRAAAGVTRRWTHRRHRGRTRWIRSLRLVERSRAVR